MQKLAQDKYVETVAKVQLEWSNLVRPAAEAYIEFVVSTVKDNEDCNQQCVYQTCYRPNIDVSQCFLSCGCVKKAHFRDFQVAGENVTSQVAQYGQKVAAEFAAKDKEFKQKELKLTYKFYDFLERQAVSAGGCDAVCVDRCTNPIKFGLDRVGDCLERCDCNGGILKLSEGEFEINRLSLYSKDMASFEQFKKNFPY